METYISLLHPTTPTPHPIGHITEELYVNLCELRKSSWFKTTPVAYQDIIDDPKHPAHDHNYTQKQQSQLYDGVNPENPDQVWGQGTFNVFAPYCIARKSVHCFLYRYINEQLYILIQKRGLGISSPSLFDVSAGGWVDAGETPEQAIYREMFEEIGLKKADTRLTMYSKTYHNNLSSLFYGECLLPAEDFFIQSRQEVDSVTWESYRQIKRATCSERHHYFNDNIDDISKMSYTPGFHGAFREFIYLVQSGIIHQKTHHLIMR